MNRRAAADALVDLLFSSEMKAYDEDKPLMESLGLRTENFKRKWTRLGTVVHRKTEPRGRFGPRPRTAIKVEVSAMPAHFWRFTITRPRDDAKTVDGEVVGIYRPLQVYVMETGSGSFRDYWPTAVLIADHMISISVSERE